MPRICPLLCAVRGPEAAPREAGQEARLHEDHALSAESGALAETAATHAARTDTTLGTGTDVARRDDLARPFSKTN